MRRLDTFEGVGARVYADTRPGMAQLKALEAYGARVRAGLQGTPIAPVASNVPSPLIAPVPDAAIPGGGVDRQMRKARSDRGNDKPTPGEKAHARRQATYRRLSGDLTPEEATAAASKRAGAAFGAHKGMQNAAAAASASAMEQHKDRMLKELGKPIRLESGGANVGGFNFGPKGFALESMVMRTLGPAAGLAIAVGAGIYVTTAVSEAGNRIIYEAAERGVSVGQVIQESFPEMLRNASEGGYDLGARFVNSVLNSWGAQAELATSFFGEMAGHVPKGSAAKVRQVFERTKQGINDWVANLKGEPTQAQMEAQVRRQADAEIQIIANNVARKAAEQAKEAAGVLQGLGFSGTRKALAEAAWENGIKRAANTAIEEEAALVRQRNAAALQNGKQ